MMAQNSFILGSQHAMLHQVPKRNADSTVRKDKLQSS